MMTGCSQDAPDVTSHAQGIAFEQRFAGMNVVTIDAPHAGGVHLAAEERGEFVVFVAHLAIGVKQVGFINAAFKGIVVKEISVPAQNRRSVPHAGHDTIRRFPGHLIPRRMGERLIRFPLFFGSARCHCGSALLSSAHDIASHPTDISAICVFGNCRCFRHSPCSRVL